VSKLYVDYFTHNSFTGRGSSNLLALKSKMFREYQVMIAYIVVEFYAKSPDQFEFCAEFH